MFAFSDDDKDFLVSSLQEYWAEMHRSCFSDGLVRSGRDQTWMDTSFGSDSREGACVEIQALGLATLRVLSRLRSRTIEEEIEFRQKVQAFFDGNVLCDRLGDPTVRPNVFIAAYVYPQLFTKGEWEVIIDSALDRLWLEWGGLSSIDRGHPLFKDTYTGETRESYHRGDSWFWLNNLAAIVMLRVNTHKYRDRIERIIDASVHETLFSGALGHHAEVSSAKELRSEGCLSQAWSAAMLVELLHEYSLQ